MKRCAGTDEIPSRVAVAIVSYGNYEGLERTVSSVLNQNYPIETIILSDDGSKKPFPEKIVSLLSEVPCHTIIRNGEENLGTTAHLNLLAGMCSSTYLKFIAAGDAFSDHDALGALVEFLHRTGVAVATSNVIVASPDLSCEYYTFPGSPRKYLLNKSGTELFRALAKENVISAVGTIFHRKFFSEMNGFDERYRLLEDWPTWLRLAREGYDIPFLDRVTCLYAVGGSSSQSGNAFYSEILRGDMLGCYEREIFPFLEQFSTKDAQYVKYHYQLLQNDGTWALWKKYGLLHLRHLIKRGAKWGLLRTKNMIRKLWSV